MKTYNLSTMSFSDEGKSAPPLQTLRSTSTLATETLARLQSILLLQILVSLSQSLNSSMDQSEALARTLLLDGRQRLQRLLAAAPRLNLPLDRVLEILHAADQGDQSDTTEENAVQALLEMCLGLMLQWLSRAGHASYTPTLALKWHLRTSSDNLPLSRPWFYPSGKRVGSPPTHAALTG
jgi:hypothetical protein